MNVTLLRNLNLKPLRKRVNYRRADAVQTARNLIAASAELAARVKHRKNDRNRRKPLLLVNADGYSAAVIANGYYIPGKNFNLNMSTKSRKSLIYRVIYNFINKVMKTFRPRGAYVHTGSFSYSFKSFKHLNGACVVLFGYGSVDCIFAFVDNKRFFKLFFFNFFFAFYYLFVQNFDLRLEEI